VDSAPGSRPQAKSGDHAQAGTHHLYGRHQREREDGGPQRRIAERGAGDRIRGDAGRVVIRGAGNSIRGRGSKKTCGSGPVGQRRAWQLWHPERSYSIGPRSTNHDFTAPGLIAPARQSPVGPSTTRPAGCKPAPQDGQAQMWENTRVMRAILEEKIRTRAARVGIVAWDTGLPLAVEFARAGFSVTGIDVSQEKARRVNAGDSYVGDVPNATLGPLVESGKLRATSDFSAVADLAHHQHLRTHTAAQDQRPGHELNRLRLPENRRALSCGDAHHSGTHHLPGTTDELVLPMLSKSGLEVGRDFSSCASPRSAWTRAIRNSRPSTFPRWWGAPRRRVRKMGELFYAPGARARGAGGLHASGRDGPSCWRTLSA